MTDALTRNTKLFVVAEDSEGVYKAPSSEAEGVQVLNEGLELAPARELIERAARNGSIGKSSGLMGQRSVTGSVPVEFKAGESAGAAPEYSLLLKGALGSMRAQVSDLTASDEDGGSHSSSRICLGNADKDKVKKGDVIHIVRGGADADHIAAVVAVSNADGSVHVDVSPALASGSFKDGDVIKGFTTYACANAGHPSLSLTKEVDGGVLEKAIGCKVTSMSLNNWAVGQIADWAFGVEGLSYDRALGSTSLNPSYDANTPPLILGACLLVDGAMKPVSEVALSVENTLAFKTATSSLSGRIASRVTARAVSGSFSPYKQNDDIAFFEKFDENTKFSLLLYAYNPVPGSGGKNFKEVVSIFLPDCRITELAEADKDGLLQEAISFQATRGADGAEDEIFISMS